MNIAELFAVDHITGIILNDQPEFFSSRVFEFNMEDDAVIVGAYICNGYLSVRQA